MLKISKKEKISKLMDSTINRCHIFLEERATHGQPKIGKFSQDIVGMKVNERVENKGNNNPIKMSYSQRNDPKVLPFRK